MDLITFNTSKNNYLFNPINGHIYLYKNIKNFGESKVVKNLKSLKNIVSKVVPGYTFEEVKEAISGNLKQMTLCVTQNCNLRCSYCVYSGQFQNFRTHKNISMSNTLAIDAADYFLKHASPYDDLYFTFYGGEPLLNLPLISKVSKYLKKNLKNRINFSITTNGTIINKKIIEYIKKNKVFLTISLDGNKYTHDKNRKFKNGNGSFDKILKNLEKLKSSLGELFNTYVSFSVTLNAGCDYKELDSFFNNFRNSVRVSGVMFYGSNSLDSIANTSKNMSFLVDKYKEGVLNHAFDDDYTKEPYRFSASVISNGIKSIHLRKIADKKIHQKTFLLKKHCIPGSTKLFVTPSGDLFPCEKLDSFSHLKVGNIYSSVDPSLVYNYLNEYSELRNKFCKDCFLIDFCDQCFLSASNGEDWDEEKMMFYCNNARNEYLKAFTIYADLLEKDLNAFNFIDKDMSISPK